MKPMTDRILALLMVIWAASLAESPVAAHPISLTDAVINVTEKSIDVQLRVLAEDLVLYQNVLLKEADTYAYKDLLAAAEKHREFVLAGLIFRDAAGTRLKGEIQKIDASQVPEKGVLLAEAKQASVTYSIVFAIDRANFLTVSQQFGGEKAVLPSLMDCMFLQSDVLLEKPVQLFGRQTHTVRLDWDNPPQKAKNWRELRARSEEEFRKRLGIASYSGLYSFIYVTEHEIRHEVLVPLLTLESWVPLKRDDKNLMTLVEQQTALESIERLMREKARITIDGLSVRPVVSRVNFFGLDINDFALDAKPRDVSIHNARVGVILSYPTKGMPDKVELSWELFTEHAPFVRSIVLAFEQDPVEHFFRESDRLFSWQRDADVVASSIVPTKRAAEAVTQQTAQPLVSSLLRNIYRAFDYPTEGDTYDALALSVQGDLLRQTYLQIRRSLLMAEQGGAKANVKDVSVTNATLVSTAAAEFTVDVTWEVTGSVEHWGHVHTRRNEYQARLVLRGDTTWKIEGLELKQQERLEFKTGLREAKPKE